MDGEIKNFVIVWISVFASLCYCYFIGKVVEKGKIRLLAVLPVVCLFLFLPLNLSSMHLGGTTSFFIAWLANFKLLLFAFDKGPLSSSSLSLSRFISIACLPINLRQDPPSKSQANGVHPSPQIAERGSKSPLNYAVKVLFMAVLFRLYDYRQYIHPKLILLLYCFHIYLGLELILAVVAAMVRTLLGLELEPQFDEPYLSTSLQDFWGRRWNIMVSSVLRPSVYEPVRSFSLRILGRRWAPLPAVVGTFIVSGVMHELIFFYLGRKEPTWEITCFFVLHGVCLAAEMVAKTVLTDRWRLPPWVSGPLALGFVVVTGFWLFFPQFLRYRVDTRGLREYAAVVEFAKGVGRAVRLGLQNVARSA